MRNAMVVAAWTLAASLQPVAAAGLPGPLVTPEWVSAHLGEVTVLDIREDPESFTAEPVFEADAKTGAKVLSEVGGHVPGARLVDYADARVEREIGGHRIKGMLPDRVAFEALMRAAGIGAGRPVVIASPGATLEDLDTAARLYWSLKFYGEDDVAILDGGTAGWLQAGLAFETAAPAAVAGDWTASAERRELLADSEDVARALAQGTQVIDARPLPFYLGLQKKPNVAAPGRIAGALNFPPDVRAVPADGGFRFLTPDQYRKVFARFGIDTSEPAVTYCNTGHLASGAWFVLSELLGNREVRLYDGSMTQWTAEGRPVVALR